jgi:Zn finger protein HypA/HybF involved in hydrogenase expression
MSKLIHEKYPEWFGKGGNIKPAAPQKIKQLVFLEKAKNKHGVIYDYSLVKLISSQEKVTIICKEHGKFEQTPNGHLRGGCLKCSGHYVKTNNDVINEFNNVHNYRYDYSLVDFKTGNTPVVIICKEHGEFKKRPLLHRQGQGCPSCTKSFATPSKRRTQSEVLERFKETHGNSYDYSLVQFKTIKEKVTIICKEHGGFEQSPEAHVRGNGCPACSGNRPPTTAEFKAKLIKVHKERYDYSLVTYTKSNSRIIIICKEHGEFEQIAEVHAAGMNCPKCSNKNVPSNDEVISRFKKIHDERYDYSSVKYMGNKYPVKIICKEHGEFEQLYTHHVNGFGCSACSGNAAVTKDNLITRFQSVHGEQYDYSLITDVSVGEKVTIICPEHGEFKQIYSDHSNGHGCPKCSNCTTDNDAIYIWKDIQGNHKIGVSSFRLGEKRIYNCARKRNTKASDIRLIKCDNAMEHEFLLLTLYPVKPYGAETGDGYTEFRTLTSEEVSEVHAYFDFINVIHDD